MQSRNEENVSSFLTSIISKNQDLYDEGWFPCLNDEIVSVNTCSDCLEESDYEPVEPTLDPTISLTKHIADPFKTAKSNSQSQSVKAASAQC